MSDAPDTPAVTGDGLTASPLVPQSVEASLQPVIKDLPEPKQQEIVRTFEQQFMAVVRGGMTPQIDPETAKILAVTIEKDNDNKFHYLTQKQADAAAQETREHDLAIARHRDLMRPIVWAVILIAIASVAAGLAFIVTGHDAVGSSLLTGIFGALLGYLGGLGTSGHLAKKG